MTTSYKQPTTCIHKVNPREQFAEAIKLLKVDLYYDVRECRAFLGDRPVSERNMQSLRYRIGERFTVPYGKGEKPLMFGRQAFYDLREAYLNDRERDPFREWLEKRPYKDLDITKGDADAYELSVDRMLENLFGVEASQYSRHISRAIVLAAVWRTMKPGCAVHEIPVIQGPQGIGKDALLRSLVPWRELHTESFSFSSSPKERVEVTRGKVYAVASEMGGVTTTKDIEHLKQYITNPADTLRLSYRRDQEYLPRMFTFICTTNLETPLPSDPTGNRRFMVVRAGPSRVGRVEDWIDEYREELWAECLWLYHHGYSHELPRDLKDVQTEDNLDYERVDEAVEEAFNLAMNTGSIDLYEPHKLSEIAVALSLCDTIEEFGRGDGSARLQHRVRDVLTKRGWKRRQMRKPHERVPCRMWVSPEYQTLTASELQAMKDKINQDIDKLAKNL